MFVIAGYINYEYNKEREADLGKTVYVNSNIEENKENKNNEKTEEKEYVYKTDIISVFRNDRENIYTETISNYESTIKNPSSTDEIINEYQKKLTNIIKEKNSVGILETIIKAYGIMDVAIVPMESGDVNIVIKAEKNISETLKSKIKEVVAKELSIKTNQINIEIIK